MAARIRAAVIGADVLKKAVADYGQKVLRPAAKRGVTAGAKEVSSMARSLVPKRTKSLRRAIGWKVAAKKKGFGYVGVIGARRDTKKDRAAATAAEAAGRKSKKTLFRRTVKYKGREVVTNPANYAHLVEFGRRAVAVSKKKVLADGSMVFGKGVKAVPPRPFMRPAFEQTKGHCESLIAQHLRLAVLGGKPA